MNHIAPYLKEQIVKEIINKKHTPTTASKYYGVSRTSIYRWLKKFN